jgi:Tol biopolymer transport system component
MTRGSIDETGSRKSHRVFRRVLALGLLALCGMAGGAGAGEVELVSRVHPTQISDTGAGAESLIGFSPPSLLSPSSISADGRYLVFISTATNLVPGQDESRSAGEPTRDVFLHDLVTGTTVLVRPPAATPGLVPEFSTAAALSADGRYVAFLRAGLEPTEHFRSAGLFLYDRVSGSASVVASPSPEQSDVFFSSPVLSANGRYVAFVSNAQDLFPGQQDEFETSMNVFLYDRVEKKFRLVSHVSGSASTAGEGRSSDPVISADGRYVAFLSTSDLVPGQIQTENIFLYDRTTDALTLIGPGTPPVMSSDGRYLAFFTGLGLSLYDRVSQTTTRVGGGLPVFSSFSHQFAISADGRFVAFVSSDDHLVPGQEGDTQDGLFLYDRVSRTITLVSRRNNSPTRSGGTTATPTISGDGRYIAFASGDPGMVPGQIDVNGSSDIFLFDRNSGKVALVSTASDSSFTTADAASYAPVLSANGARLVFLSQASNLVPGLKDLNQGVDVFSYETASKEKSAVSARVPEMPSLSSGGRSFARSLSADGRYVAFESDSTFLISGQVDTNGETDVFLYDRIAKTTVLVSRSAGSATRTSNGHSVHPVLSGDGRYIVFASNATDLVAGASHTGQSYDVFLHDRSTGRTTLVGRSNGSSPPESANEFITFQISSDGRYVVFTSDAADVVPGQQEHDPNGFWTLDVFLHDRVTGSTLLVSRSNAGPLVTGNSASGSPVISADGRYVAFGSGATDLIAGQIDEFATRDLFLFDRVTASMALVSHVQGSPLTAAGSVFRVPSMSSDGQFLLFSGDIEDLSPGSTTEGPGVFLYDRLQRANKLIAPWNVSTPFQISADGRYAAFLGFPGLTPGVTADFFLYDRISGTFTSVGQGPSGHVESLAISADGRYVAFASDGRSLVAGQTSPPLEEGDNMFLFDRISRTMTLLSSSRRAPRTGLGRSENPLISASGQQVAFTSSAALVEDDFNLLPDAYLFDLASGSSNTVPLPRCTLLDTRRAADRPVLRSNSRRVLKVHGACGVPARAKSVSVKVTVLQSTGKGNLQFYPGNSTTARSGILRFERQQTRSGNFVLPLATNGSGTLAILPSVAGNGTVHVVVEVNGYVE